MDPATLRILYVTQYFWPEPFSNNMIARALVARGHRVDVIPCVPNYPEGRFFEGYSHSARREEVWEGVHVHRVRTVPRGRRSWQLALNFAAYPLAALWTALRRTGRADVSFCSLTSPLTQAVPAIWLRWLRGTPVVIWVQDIWPESVTVTLGLKNRAAVAVLEWICGWIYRRADLVLVQSRAFPPMIERFGVAPGRIRFFPNTAAALYRPMAPGDAPDEGALMPAQGFRLMFAGNIGESQDFETLVAAADLLRGEDVHWVILGSGRGEAAARAGVAARGLEERFHFLGRHPEAAMPRFFAHADAMLVSLRDEAIFRLTVPFKMTGYMACGKPVVASLTGEGARIVEAAGAGVTAPASSPEALAAAIRRMIAAGPGGRAVMGTRARAYFEAEYAEDKVLSDLEGWLREAVAERA